MKVFMSWSEPRSHEVAKLLGDWLESVIQAVKPWISSAGIERGEQWFRKISDNLSEVNIGIVCLTPENKENPWIMFEAGALLKGLSDARIMTFLIDLKPQDVREPLSQFNHTTASKSDMLKLVQTLNSRLGEGALKDAKLLAVFETFWPEFEEKYNAIMVAHKPKASVTKRPDSEILSEVLETVRGLKQQLRHVATPSLDSFDRFGQPIISGGAEINQAHGSGIDMLQKMKKLAEAGLPINKIISLLLEQGFPAQPVRKYARMLLNDSEILTTQDVFGDGNAPPQ